MVYITKNRFSYKNRSSASPIYIYITETFDFWLTSSQFSICIFYLYFLIWFNSFDFIAPNCRKFIKFIFKKLNLVVWCHTTTILKGDLNCHLIREFLDNPNKLYNNSININLSQQTEYISINLIISTLITFKKKKKKAIIFPYIYQSHFLSLLFFIFFFILMLIRNYNFNKI